MVVVMDKESCVTPCKCCNSIKLFGVQIDVGGRGGNDCKKDEDCFIRKSKSLGNLEAAACITENTPVEAGYLSDGFIHQPSRSKERKRGKPWTEEEHRSFLIGLEKLGKGDWKGIAKNYVPSRNPSQVASHAQKYFIRLSASEKKRRRTSVFDIPLNDSNPSSQASPASQSNKAPVISQLASSSDAVLRNTGEFKVQAKMPPTITSEKPPLSPMAKSRGISDFRRMPYMAGVSCINQGLLEYRTTRPTVSWFPILNLPNNQNHVFLPSTSMTQTFGTFLPQPTGIAMRDSIHKRTSSQAANSNGVSKNNNALNLNIGELNL